MNTINARAKRSYDADYANHMDSPCPIHKGSKHTMDERKGLNKAFHEEDRKRSRCKDDKTDDGQEEDHGKDTRPAYQDPSKTITSIFSGKAATETKREQKLTVRQIMSITTYDDTIAHPKYLDWSKYHIAISREDQWADIPYPSCIPLILDPIIIDTS